MEPRGTAQITQDLAQFIAERDHFYFASASAKGAPYLQHRGGPRGFLKVLSETELGYADFGGNQQYVTLGNLKENPAAFIFLIDYVNRRRIKLWGEARAVETDPALTRSLAHPGYRARVERAILFKVSRWDVNCSAHITPRYAPDVLEPAFDRLENRIKALEAQDPTRMSTPPVWHGTTILSVRKGGKVVVAGDGQVSMGDTVIKNSARKVRPLAGGTVIGGFAGATADAFTLFERLEAKLEQYPGQLMRACVELAKDWRTDRYLRRLEAMMIVADKETTLVLTGTGDVLEPEHGVTGIGSGGNYALSAARALVDMDMDAEDIARKAMGIAADICVYTNSSLTVETLDADG
eukprot:s1_g680.t1